MRGMMRVRWRFRSTSGNARTSSPSIDRTSNAKEYGRRMSCLLNGARRVLVFRVTRRGRVATFFYDSQGGTMRRVTLLFLTIAFVSGGGPHGHTTARAVQA